MEGTSYSKKVSIASVAGNNHEYNELLDGPGIDLQAASLSDLQVFL